MDVCSNLVRVTPSSTFMVISIPSYFLLPLRIFNTLPVEADIKAISHSMLCPASPPAGLTAIVLPSGLKVGRAASDSSNCVSNLSEDAGIRKIFAPPKPLEAVVAIVLPSGLKATSITACNSSSSISLSSLPVATDHRYKLPSKPLPSPLTIVLPSGLKARHVTS